jgi:DNA-binding FadR family transcriptional regulator
MGDSWMQSLEMSRPFAMKTKDSARGASRHQVIRIPKAAEMVSRELRTQIVRGEVKEGESLAPESELMTRFGISRPTLREAIRILESEGLISISRGARGGAVVHAPSVEVATRYVSLLLQASGTTLSDIYLVHMLVEPAAARIVAERYSKTAPQLLRECIEEGRLHFDNDFDFGVAAARFRHTLIQLANIPTLSLLMGMLNSIFERYWATVTMTAGQQIDNTQAKRRGLRSLEKLITLIEAGDGAGAEAHWRRHTQLVERAMSAWLPAAKVIDLLDEQ